MVGASLCTGAGMFDLGFQRGGIPVGFQCELEESAVKVLAHHYIVAKEWEVTRIS